MFTVDVKQQCNNNNSKVLSVHTYQVPHSAASDLDLHCLPVTLKTINNREAAIFAASSLRYADRVRSPLEAKSAQP